MATPQIYIIIAIVLLLILFAVIFFLNKKKGKKPEKISLLIGFAFGFIIAGIFFSDNSTFSYSLLGIGVVLAIIDVIVKSKKKKK